MFNCIRRLKLKLMHVATFQEIPTLFSRSKNLFLRIFSAIPIKVQLILPFTNQSASLRIILVIRVIHKYSRVSVCAHIPRGTYARRDIPLVGVLRRYLVLIVIIVLGTCYVLSEVEQPTIRAVGRSGQIVGQVWEAGVGRTAPMSRQAVMFVIAITTGPGLSGSAATRGLSLCTVTIHPGHVMT